MSLDDVTANTNGTVRTVDSDTSSSARLNEALRQAAQEAGTRNIDFNEKGDTSAGNQEIAGAFKPWIQKGQRISFDMEDMSGLQDQENINPLRNDNAQSRDDDDYQYSDIENEDLSMEITSAVGKILGGVPNSQNLNRRKSIAEQTNYDEQTMELTNVVGGIEATPSPAKSDAESIMNDDEEMTMEFTSVVGGVLNKNTQQSRDLFSETPQRDDQTGRDFSEWGDGDEDDDAAMEFTGAVGRILSPIEERTESHDGNTAGMDITTAMGRILPPGLDVNSKEQAKQLMELESDAGQLVSSPFQHQVQSPPKSLVPPHITVASETGSPSFSSARSRQTRRGSASSVTRLSPSKQTTPNKPRTPSKQLTPQPGRPTTPGKTPPSSNITFRSASPKKLFREEIRASGTKQRSPGRSSLFENSAGGESTPAFILRPHPRYSSGLGADREGLGSPKVAEILDRRRSIGEDAEEFVAQEQSPRRLRFEDPVKLHEEFDREREEEEHREETHVPPLQASELDTTSSLRDLISSLTPKKRKVGARKSLHVGAAKGILGKRPAELDDDEEETPKRIRAAAASPVKPVKLPAPPSKDETVGRSSRISTGRLFDLSPERHGNFTPRGKPPVMSKSPTKLRSPSKSVQFTHESSVGGQTNDEDATEDDLDWDPIQLQDFLNLTNIHFMELTTTKRRHTTVPGNDSTLSRVGSPHLGKADISLEDCVAAGFCTVPMLELYQHVSDFFFQTKNLFFHAAFND
jgi:kinetochore protein Spc7/SPC105